MIRYAFTLLIACCFSSPASAVFILDNSLSVESIESFGLTGPSGYSFDVHPTHGTVYLSSHAWGGLRKVSDDTELLTLGSPAANNPEIFRTISYGADGLVYATSSESVWKESGGQLLRHAPVTDGTFTRIAADTSGNIVVAELSNITGFDASGTQTFSISEDARGVLYDDGTFYWLDADYTINTVDTSGNVASTGLQFSSDLLVPFTLPMGIWKDGDAWFTAVNLNEAFGPFVNSFGIYRLMDGETQPLAFGTDEFGREIRVIDGTLYIPGFRLGTLEDFDTEPVFGNSLQAGGIGFLMADENSIAQINGVLGQLSGFDPPGIPEPSSGLLLFLGACLICRSTSHRSLKARKTM